MQTHRIDLNEPSKSDSAKKEIKPEVTAKKTVKTVPVDDPALEPHNQQVGTRLRQYSEKSKQKPMAKKPKFVALLITILLAIGLGVGTGYAVQPFLPGSEGKQVGLGAQPTEITQVAGDNVEVGDIFGSADTETFDTNAEGYVEEGGIDGEGSHSLLRSGGPSQTVYLTSSVTDLAKFEGMTVKVWGETFRGQKAGWLMDVGRVEVVALEGEKP